MHGTLGTFGFAGWLLGASVAAAAPGGHAGEIAGQIRHSKTGEPIRNALVILQCTCLSSSRETQTDEHGLYAFWGLPAGTYTIQVLVGGADVSKVVTLPSSRHRSLVAGPSGMGVGGSTVVRWAGFDTPAALPG